MTIRRRDLIAGAASLAAVAEAVPLLAQLPPAGLGVLPDDEAYWATVAAHYDVTREVIQLENGNWGMMPRAVLAAYRAQIERVNRDTSYYARRGMVADLAAVRGKVADLLGVAPDEIVLTRNATEAMKVLIGGYNRLKPGDTVLYADLDYDAMQAAMRALAGRRGVKARKIDLPEPATWQGLVDAYAAAFQADPSIRMVLLTHLSHRTGLVLPVREIALQARMHGVEVILDAAHSLGQIDFALADLGVDFAGFNLHKWIGAPLGVGVLYVRKERIGAIDPDPANDPADTIDARVHTGTVDYAAALTVPQALAFHETISAPARAGRLRALRDRWVTKARAIDGIEILTPDDGRLHGAITAFRLRGHGSDADNSALAKALLEQHGIFTVARTGVARGSCVRVTPALCNSLQDVDRLAEALAMLAPKLRR